MGYSQQTNISGCPDTGCACYSQKTESSLLSCALDFKTEGAFYFQNHSHNRMNEALNYIMSMLENGTNLYEEFQTYFTTQKELFKSSGDSSYQELTQYFVNLKAQGDSSLAQIEKTYEEHMTTYEGEQTAAFNTWFAGIKGKLNEDIAGSLQNQITEVDERLAALEHMTLKNLFTVPVAIDNTGTTLLADDLGNAIVADWKYKEE